MKSVIRLILLIGSLNSFADCDVLDKSKFFITDDYSEMKDVYGRLIISDLDEVKIYEKITNKKYQICREVEIIHNQKIAIVHTYFSNFGTRHEHMKTYFAIDDK